MPDLHVAIGVRLGERKEIESLAKTSILTPPKGEGVSHIDFSNPETKIWVILDAFLGQGLPLSALRHDLVSILPVVIRVARLSVRLSMFVEDWYSYMQTVIRFGRSLFQGFYSVYHKGKSPKRFERDGEDQDVLEDELRQIPIIGKSVIEHALARPGLDTREEDCIGSFDDLYEFILHLQEENEESVVIDKLSQRFGVEIDKGQGEQIMSYLAGIPAYDIDLAVQGKYDEDDEGTRETRFKVIGQLVDTSGRKPRDNGDVAYHNASKAGFDDLGPVYDDFCETVYVIVSYLEEEDSGKRVALFLGQVKIVDGVDSVRIDDDQEEIVVNYEVKIGFSIPRSVQEIIVDIQSEVYFGVECEIKFSVNHDSGALIKQED